MAKSDDQVQVDKLQELVAEFNNLTNQMRDKGISVVVSFIEDSGSVDRTIITAACNKRLDATGTINNKRRLVKG